MQDLDTDARKTIFYLNFNAANCKGPFFFIIIREKAKCLHIDVKFLTSLKSYGLHYLIGLEGHHEDFLNAAKQQVLFCQLLNFLNLEALVWKNLHNLHCMGVKNTGTLNILELTVLLSKVVSYLIYVLAS